MVENFEQPTQLSVLTAQEKARNTERQKYVAAAIDRLSTAVAVVGFLGPIVGIANVELNHKAPFYLIESVVMMTSIAVSYGLHLYGRMQLERGFE
ncbi:hypothetical protein [Phyllobacterium zundukense]|jgi:hypothetical protein|uniref:Uncharacterized protein n=1 Tax=Phyllobacterium zundukense TaxID=1867719 RepID=A0ACD4D3P6_9HYPH|nr:hypothetical protein [Phyllobacterium zundukense]UXN60547.1 hypothetical protein N8E88_29330 [Phyllobacterium zundukense]